MSRTTSSLCSRSFLDTLAVHRGMYSYFELIGEREGTRLIWEPPRPVKLLPKINMKSRSEVLSELHTFPPWCLPKCLSTVGVTSCLSSIGSLLIDLFVKSTSSTIFTPGFEPSFYRVTWRLFLTLFGLVSGFTSSKFDTLLLHLPDTPVDPFTTSTISASFFFMT